MVKYGGMTEEQALAMITINPARELGLERRLGSIEVGKDADIALFNGHPFDAFARCELALIDGEVYFQRAEPDGKFAVRPGDHHKMPQVPEAARNHLVDFTAQPKGVFALVGANLHPISGLIVKAGTIIVKEGKIAALGSAGTPVPPEAQTIDLSGLDIWPGLVDAGSALGLIEIGSLNETQDFADTSRFQPELRTSTALRPDSEHIPVTRANGVLTAYVEPSGGLISGQGCVINLRGWVPRGARHGRSSRFERDHSRVHSSARGRSTSARPSPESRSWPWPQSRGWRNGARPAGEAKRTDRIHT